jgi:hypothetical protein
MGSREETYTRIGQVSQCVTLRFDGHNFDINGPGGYTTIITFILDYSSEFTWTSYNIP